MPRLKYIDIAKGLLILCLCFTHYSHTVSRCGLSEQCVGNVTAWHWLFSVFFMQAFFFITGYCSNFNKQKNKFTLDNIKTLVVPAIVFTLADRLLMAMMLSHDRASFLDIMRNGVGFWFLWTLCFCKMLHYFVIRKICHNRPRIEFAVYLIMVVVGFWSWLRGFPNWMFYQHVCAMGIFLFLGEWMKERQHTYAKMIKKGWVAFPVVVVIIAYFNLPYSIVSGTFAVGSLKEVPIYLVVATLGTIFVLSVSSKISSCTLLEKAGVHSLWIYGVHTVIITSIVKTFSECGFYDNISPTAIVVLYIVTCLLTFSLSLALGLMLSNTKVYKGIMGKW